ncbi:MAG: HDIG domain-containing protein [Longimicrobiales bacterium]|nr:HDIG domain-containing protein [Longimicrobiales bacterium]
MSRAPRPGPSPAVGGGERPDGLLHHGVRVSLVLGLAILTTTLFPPDPRLRVQEYGEGTIAAADIVAEVRFSVPVSPAELERARNEARVAVPPTLDFHAEAADTSAARLGRFFARLQEARAQGERAGIRRLLVERSIAATPAQVELLTDSAAVEALRRAALRAAREILPSGVTETDLRGVPTSTVVLRDPTDGSERSVDREVPLSASDFLDRASRFLPDGLPSAAQQLLSLILVQNIQYSLALNGELTEANRDRMARAVPTTKQTVLPGEPVVRANEEVTPAVLERLAAYEEALRGAGILDERAETRGGAFLGATLLNLLVLGVFWAFMYLFRGEVYDRTRWVALVAVLVGVYLAGAAVVVRSGWPVEALPVVFSALAVAVLWDGRMALVLVMVLAVLTSAQSGLQGLDVLVPTFVGGAAAGMSVRVVRSRAQTWVFIAFIFSAYATALVALHLVYGEGLESLGVSLAAAGGNAVVSAILAMGFIPVFEMVTGITTDQTLLEWGDPNRPLLRRLSMEAPGTYAHTINVANLAEGAASAIGANGLLCRVGLYYHDVGKMLKPHYFVENQPDGRNPHDRLKPDTSAAIVREHVTEGLKLAREENVPAVITDFITEHHGTQHIGFFWDRAVEEFGEENLDPEDYRYPGPRPRTRETAIAMLADSVESATRVLQDPTPERVRDLVDSVVEAKISSRQLDDAPLTFREVARIKDQFVKVVCGVHHHRLDYPETRHLTEAPDADADRNAEAESARDRSAEAAPPPDRDEGGGGGEGAEAASGAGVGSGPARRTRGRRRPEPSHPELPLDGPGGDRHEGDA